MENIVGIEIEKEVLIIKEYIGTILFSEFPSTMLCIDNSNNLYVKEWVDCSEDGKTDRYFYFKTSERYITSFISNQLSHLDLIKKCEDGFVYFQDRIGTLYTNYTIVDFDKIPLSYLPDVKFKTDKNDVVDYEKIDKYLHLRNIDKSLDVSVLVKNSPLKNKNPIT